MSWNLYYWVGCHRFASPCPLSTEEQRTAGGLESREAGLWESCQGTPLPSGFWLCPRNGQVRGEWNLGIYFPRSHTAGFLKVCCDPLPQTTATFQHFLLYSFLHRFQKPLLPPSSSSLAQNSSLLSQPQDTLIYLAAFPKLFPRNPLNNVLQWPTCECQDLLTDRAMCLQQTPFEWLTGSHWFPFSENTPYGCACNVHPFNLIGPRIHIWPNQIIHQRKVVFGTKR